MFEARFAAEKRRERVGRTNAISGVGVERVVEGLAWGKGGSVLFVAMGGHRTIAERT